MAINSGNGLLSIDSTGADEGDYLRRGPDGFEWQALPIKLKAYSGSLSGNGWATLQGRNSSGGVLTVAYNNSPATWNSGTYSASLVFGSSDTKGLVDMAYNTPIVTFGGASSNGSTDAAPTWYIKLQGTNGCTYTLPSSTSTLGSVTSVTITQGTGITVSDSGTAITSSGTRTISVTSANVSTMMNLLSEGSSNATRNDYIIA